MLLWNIEEFISYLSKYEQILTFRISFNSGIRYGELLGLAMSVIHDDYIDIKKSMISQ